MNLRGRPAVAASVTALLLLSACATAALVRGPAAFLGRGGGGGEGARAQSRLAQQSLAAQPAAVGTGQLEPGSLTVGGERRDYFLFVPDSARTGQPAPLVLALHGGGGGAEQFASRMSLVDMASRYGYILALPEGVRGSWNYGEGGTGYAARSGVDDVGFVSALVSQLESTLPVDRSRVYAAGFSAGGMMTYRLACDLPGTFSAVAVVAGTLVDQDCPGAGQVSLLQIHGTDDQNVPMAGGAGADSARRANYPPVMQGFQLFQSSNQCFAGGQTVRPSSDTTCTVQACGDGNTVEFCQVQGGGHAWPGADPARWQETRGVYVSQSFDATDYIAQFFQAN